MENWPGIFPELLEIEDTELRNKVQETCQEALEESGMTMEQLLHMPFTLLIPETDVTYIEHVQAVVRMTSSVCRDFCGCYDGNRYPRCV